MVIDSIKMNEIKTKEFAKFLSAVNAESKPLVVTAEPDANVVRSGRNIPGCEITFANLINVYDILNAKKLVLDRSARNIPGIVTSPANLINVYDIMNANEFIVDKAALAVIEEVFA